MQIEKYIVRVSNDSTARVNCVIIASKFLPYTEMDWNQNLSECGVCCNLQKQCFCAFDLGFHRSVFSICRSMYAR